MNNEQIREIADAILYEGYLLYPYRHSSVKNRQRWTFGVVYPQAYSKTQRSNEPWQMRTECLVSGLAEKASLDVTMRFLHLLMRTSEATEAYKQNGHPEYEAWEEGRGREVAALNLSLHELIAQPKQVAISFPAEHLVEEASTEATSTVRNQKAIAGMMTISVEQVQEQLFKLSVVIENTTPLESAENTRTLRNQVLLQAFVSTHTILQVQQGTFISLLDPPDALINIAKVCKNEHTWPVLIGHTGEQNAMLSSPIILYDYPQIAPESIGTLFDGTEIDEILTLRIMTLTDEEKQEMRRADSRANALLERTESMTANDLMKLHGVIRDLHSVDEEVNR